MLMIWQLGLNQGGSLQGWVKQVGGKTYGKFASSASNFPGHLKDALNQAKTIRFNLDKVDLSRVTKSSGKLNSFGEPIGGYTNFELFTIRTNSQYLNKTVFYRNNQVVPTSEVLKYLGF